jgi:putative aminopeptidase FrvX
MYQGRLLCKRRSSSYIMIMNTSLQLLEELSLAFGPSGYEDDIREIILTHLNGVGEIKVDRIGNITCTITGSNPQAPTLLFAAHQDEIGFMINNILEDGFLSFVPIGGWNPLTLSSSTLLINTSSGSLIKGVIGQLPPHFLPKGAKAEIPEIDSLFIDIGSRSKEQSINDFGIKIGDVAVPYTHWMHQKRTNTLTSKAFDDRVGVAALIEVAHQMAKNKPLSTMIFAFTVQEEVGTRGAKVLARSIKSDYAFVVEGAPADDMPHRAHISQTKLGKGAHVRIFDPTHIGNPFLLDCIRHSAETHGISIQEAIRSGGGTDAMEIALSEGGIPTVVVGVPVRYAHSHNSMITLYDYEQLVKLLLAVSQDIGEKH